MENTGSSGFYVLLPGKMFIIPYDSNFSWLTLFYALPEELVSKRAEFLDIPRNIHDLLSSEKHKAMIETDSFLELVWDCYAWAAWQYFKIPAKDGTYKEIPGDWSHYSGNFPLWRLSYSIIRYFRYKFETELDWSFQNIFTEKTKDFPKLTYRQFGNLVGNLTDMIVEEQNWQPMIDEVWKNRQPEDYTGRNINKRDFIRSWTHSRTLQPVSMEELSENGIYSNGSQVYELKDEKQNLENVISEMHIEKFKNSLSDKDKKILQMRFEGYSLKEIAEEVGFKTSGAVHKRIEKIAREYEQI